MASARKLLIRGRGWPWIREGALQAQSHGSADTDHSDAVRPSQKGHRLRTFAFCKPRPEPAVDLQEAFNLFEDFFGHDPFKATGAEVAVSCYR